MLLEKLLGGIEVGLALGSPADGLNLSGGHHRSVVTEGVTNVGEHTSDFLIAKMLERNHRHSTWITPAFHLYGASHTMQHEFGEAFTAAGYPS